MGRFGWRGGREPAGQVATANRSVGRLGRRRIECGPFDKLEEDQEARSHPRLSLGNGTQFREMIWRRRACWWREGQANANLSRSPGHAVGNHAGRFRWPRAEQERR